MEKLKMSPKTKKIINIVIDVVVVIVLFFAAFLAVNTIRSKAKGYDSYTEILGKAYISVASDSMEGDRPEWVSADKPAGFEKDSMISIRLLNRSEIQNLEVGDVITYKTKGITNDGKWALNTHRIIKVHKPETGGVYFETAGDKYGPDSELVFDGDDGTGRQFVVGVYEGGVVKNVGFVMMFMGSSTGFILFVLVPSLLIVAYAAFNLVMVIRKEKKVQQTQAIETAKAQEEEREAELEAERERIRQELLAEMQGMGQAVPPAETPAEQPAVETPAESVSETVGEQPPEANAEPVVEAPAVETPAVEEAPAKVESAEISETIKEDNGDQE